MYFIRLWFKYFSKFITFKALKNYFVKKKKIKDFACSFFNAHALIDKGFIVLPLSVGLSKFLTKINSKYSVLKISFSYECVGSFHWYTSTDNKIKITWQGQGQLWRINSRKLALSYFLKTRRKINILLQTYKRYNGHMQGTVFTKVFTNL